MSVFEVTNRIKRLLISYPTWDSLFCSVFCTRLLCRGDSARVAETNSSATIRPSAVNIERFVEAHPALEERFQQSMISIIVSYLLNVDLPYVFTSFVGRNSYEIRFRSRSNGVECSDRNLVSCERLEVGDPNFVMVRSYSCFCVNFC